MDDDLRPEAAGSPGGVVRYTARGRHYSAAARVAIVEESYATGARVADTAACYGISRSQLHAWRKKYDGRDAAADSGRLASFAPVVIGGPGLAAVSVAAVDGDARTGRIEINCPTGYRVVVGSDVDRAALRLVLDALER